MVSFTILTHKLDLQVNSKIHFNIKFRSLKEGKKKTTLGESRLLKLYNRGGKQLTINDEEKIERTEFGAAFTLCF